MTAWTRGHLTLINSTDQVAALAQTANIPQLTAAVVDAATRWANEADALASLLGFSPSESSEIGQATLRLLDAVHTLEARAVARPPGGGLRS